MDKVDEIIQFIELLTVPSGKGEGETFWLRDFEKEFIQDIYGVLNDKGNRVVRKAILSVARKNGKTALIACLALAHLVGPARVRNGEIYSAANEREQAAIVFKYAAQIVRAEPELMAQVKIVDSTKTMIHFPTGSVYRAISAEAGSKMGLNPTVVIYDELAQAKKRDLYDALDTSMAARLEPLMVVISTQSNDPQHILSQLIDDGLSGNDETTVCHLWATPDDAEDIFTDVEIWKLANPALGDFRSMAEMKAAAARAKRMPSFENAFRNLYLNQRVDSESPFIPRAEWEGCFSNNELQEGDDVFMGLDLSGKVDLSALVAVSAGENDIVKPWFWKPKEVIREHETRDRVPYSAWVKEGYLETTPGRAVQYDFIAYRLLEIKELYNIIGLAFDRWGIDQFLNAADRVGLDCFVDGKDKAYSGSLRLVPWGQGYKDMTPAVDAMEVSILERTLRQNAHPVLTWNVSNTITVSDPAGNRKIDKSKTRFRIDGAIALAMALGLKARDLSNYGPSVYEERGVLSL